METPHPGPIYVYNGEPEGHPNGAIRQPVQCLLTLNSKLWTHLEQCPTGSNRAHLEQRARGSGRTDAVPERHELALHVGVVLRHAIAVRRWTASSLA